MAWLAALRRLFGGHPTPEVRFTVDASATKRDGMRAPTRTIPPDGGTPGRSGGESVSTQQSVRAEAGPLDGNADRRFTALLVGVDALRVAEIEPAEKRVIDRIRDLVHDSAEANLLPRLPVVLPRLISVVRRDDVAARELAERLSLDPTLVGEVVRLANSPRYRTSREISDLQDAVILLGQRGLIQIVIAATMRPIFDARHGRFSRTAGTLVWELAQRRSAACATLCDDTDRFHAFLAGMVADIGMIVALRLLDDDYTQAQAPDTEAFHDALADAVARLSGRVARQWEFHPRVCTAVDRRAGSRLMGKDDDLARALRSADRVSKFHLLAPGLAGAALDSFNEEERKCYVELERSFGA
ncbi:MAG TPA: HDOD domain-containing protein [Burkholderiaceae bacterium]